MEDTQCKLLITSNKKIIQTKIKKIFVEDLDDILKDNKKGKLKKLVKNDDLVQILYTSGTTGEPKGVLITHDNLHSNLTGALQVLKVQKNYRMLSLIPLSHIFEQVAGFLGIILKGARTTQLKSRKSSEIIKVMNQLIGEVKELKKTSQITSSNQSQSKSQQEKQEQKTLTDKKGTKDTAKPIDRNRVAPEDVSIEKMFYFGNK